MLKILQLRHPNHFPKLDKRHTGSTSHNLRTYSYLPGLTLVKSLCIYVQIKYLKNPNYYAFTIFTKLILIARQDYPDSRNAIAREISVFAFLFVCSYVTCTENTVFDLLQLKPSLTSCTIYVSKIFAQICSKNRTRTNRDEK